MSDKKEDAPEIIPGLSEEAFGAWLASSRERQGLPMKITDPGTLQQIAALFGKSQPARKNRRSHAPDRLHAAYVQRPRATDPRRDYRVVEHGFHNGATAVQGQLFPLAA